MANKRSLSTEKNIEKALFKLMQENSFADISITDLSQVAGVSRMAFYRHYKTKEDILNGYLKRQYDKFIEDIDEHRFNQLDQFLQIYFKYFKEHDYFLRAITKAGIEGIMLRKQTEYFVNFFKVKLPNMLPSYSDMVFYSGAIFSVLIYWADSGYKQPRKKIAKMLAVKIENDVNSNNMLR